MEQGESISFSADIKKYEEALAKDPKSFCFAPLSDLYRKNGMLDEAISIAKAGCEQHPGYVGGYMALGRAYYEKGEKEPSIAALEKVIQATPDNHLAQKLLSQLYLETGDNASAISSLKAVLSTHPEDAESQMMLDSLQNSRELAGDDSLFSADTSEIMGESTLEYELALDDAEVVEELESLAEEPAEPEDIRAATDSNATGTIGEGPQRDPFKTATLAELYVSQGVLDSAIDIYEELLKGDPGNKEYSRRLSEIRQALSSGIQASTVVCDMSTEREELSENLPFNQDIIHTKSHDDVIMKLEQWLEYIRRGRHGIQG